VALGTNAFLGTATQYVQVLAGILLPSAVLFLVLLCNDTEVLGPWVNGPVINFFAIVIVTVLVVLSSDLTIATLFPTINGVVLTEVCAGGAAALGVALAPVILWAKRRRSALQGTVAPRAAVRQLDRRTWRMPRLDQLAKPRQILLRTVSIYSLRAYVVVAVVIVGVKVFSPFLY